MLDGHRSLIGMASTLAVTLLLTGRVAGVQAPVSDFPFSDAVRRSVSAVFDMTRGRYCAGCRDNASN